jgi:hypothetical protein
MTMVIRAPCAKKGVEADDNQGKPGIESPIGQQRGIEGIKNSGKIHQQRIGRQQQAHQHHQKSCVIEPHKAQGALEAVGYNKGKETTDKKGGPHQGVEHAVDGEPLVIALDTRRQILVEIEPGMF